MIKAPRGHTSVYLSDYLKTNFQSLHRVMNDRGFRSLNSFMNGLLVDAINNHKSEFSIPKPDVLGDPISLFRKKISIYKDDELFKMFSTVSEKRDAMFKELKNRGVGV
jgi:hypothetical protein